MADGSISIDEVRRRLITAEDQASAARAALRESETRTRLLMESWAQAAWETDAAGVVVADSPSWRAYTGQTAEECLGYGWLDAIHPDDRGFAERQWREAIAARRLVSAEYRLRAPGGGWRWTNVRAAPVLDTEGSVEKWLGLNIDINDRKQAEAGLRESEERYRALFESMDEAYAVVEVLKDGDGRWADFRFLEVNDAFLKHTTMPWPVGKTATELLGSPNPRWTELYGRALDTGQPLRMEEPEETLGLVFDLNIFSLDRDRNRVAVLFTNVTERKQSDAALRESEERQAFLLKLSDDFRLDPDEESIGRTCVETLARHMGLDRCYITEMLEERNAGLVGPEYRTPGLHAISGEHSYVRYPDSSRRFRSGEPMISAHIAVDPTLSEIDKESIGVGLGLQAILTAFLYKGEGRTIWALAVGSAEPRVWTDADQKLVQDVAERTWAAIELSRVERALRESEARLAAAFESVPVGLAVLDTSGVTTVSNAEYRRFLTSGVMPSRDPEIGARWQGWDDKGHLLAPADFPGARALRGESVLPGQEMLYSDDDGRKVWTSVATVPTRDARGRINGAVSVIADIDAAKRAAEALRESEERFRQFGEASQDVLWIRDAETLQWQYLTPAFEQIYGLAREKALAGDNYRSWLDLIVPDDRAHAMASIERVRQGEKVAFEYRVRRPVDGAIRWLRNTDFPIKNGAGNITLFGGVGHDFTELREAELRLRALMEGIPQLVWRAVDGGHWTWASPQWTEFTGQAETDSHDFGWMNTLHPDDRDAACEVWKHAIERGEIDVEYRIYGREAHGYRWFQTRATLVRDEAGSIIEWLGTSTDIHDLRLLQDRQQVMVQELQHRTRNLITVVNALSKQTLKSATSLSDFDLHFKDRLSALSRVQGLLSHLSAGKRVTFDELLGSELAALGAPHDKVTLDGPKGVPLKSATVQTFSLALHELATNALKYGALAAPDGHLTVRWEVSHPDPGAPRLHVDWRETGVNMTHVEDHPRRGGYGRELIERALPYQLGARTSYEMVAAGVHCTIDVPASAATAGPD